MNISTHCFHHIISQTHLNERMPAICEEKKNIKKIASNQVKMQTNAKHACIFFFLFCIYILVLLFFYFSILAILCEFFTIMCVWLVKVSSCFENKWVTYFLIAPFDFDSLLLFIKKQTPNCKNHFRIVDCVVGYIDGKRLNFHSIVFEMLIRINSFIYLFDYLWKKITLVLIYRVQFWLSWSLEFYYILLNFKFHRKFEINSNYFKIATWNDRHIDFSV